MRPMRRCGTWCVPAPWQLRITDASASTSPHSCSCTGAATMARRVGAGGTSVGLTDRTSLTRHQRLAYQEMLNAVQATVERMDRLEAALVELVPAWTMAPVVTAFQAMRGVQFMTAVTMVAEAG